MRALTGKNLQFYTAPIVGYATIDGQAANQVDIPTIQAAIKEKFTAPPPAKKSAGTSKSSKKAVPIPPASTVTVDVYNGGTRGGPGHGVSQALVAKGYKAGQVTNARAQSQTVTAGTQVFYGTGASANAAKIAKYFGATAKALTSLTAGHVEVLLGTGATVVPGPDPTASGPPPRPPGRPDLRREQRRGRRRCHSRGEGKVRHSLRVLRPGAGAPSVKTSAKGRMRIRVQVALARR